jgi:carbamate kinase
MGADGLIVVALGGNALVRAEDEGRMEQQLANCRLAARSLADLIQAGHQLVLTHGNGPQIGNFLLRNEAASDRIFPLPMEIASAYVQGGMGYMIAQTLTNELERRGIGQAVTGILTTVRVHREDPAFQAPTKPIGRLLTRLEADHFVATEGWSMQEVSPNRFRRVVPSPLPQEIMEIEHIRRAVRAGEVLVACGGGGIPVVLDPVEGLSGVRAVVDKDLAGALLASELDAAGMLILTNVERVCLNFGRAGERPIDETTVSQARTWLEEGQFPAGSMGPKIRGAINFLSSTSRPDAWVTIGPLDRAVDAAAGRTGTRILQG